MTPLRDRLKPRTSAAVAWVLVKLALTAGCAPIEGPVVGLERWKCGDRFDGCDFLGTACHVTLTADLRNGTGTVKIAGTDMAERTMFRIQGIERRWDWCLADDFSYDCAFVISPDGDARYFYFASSAPDPDGTTRVKPSDFFKCTKS